MNILRNFEAQLCVFWCRRFIVIINLQVKICPAALCNGANSPFLKKTYPAICRRKDMSRKRRFRYRLSLSDPPSQQFRLIEYVVQHTWIAACMLKAHPEISRGCCPRLNIRERRTPLMWVWGNPFSKKRRSMGGTDPYRTLLPLSPIGHHRWNVLLTTSREWRSLPKCMLDALRKHGRYERAVSRLDAMEDGTKESRLTQLIQHRTRPAN